MSIFIYMSIGREPSPKAAEDDLSSKSRRAQSIAQELEREAATEEAARERKKVGGCVWVWGLRLCLEWIGSLMGRSPHTMYQSAADKKKNNNKGQQQRQEQGGNKGPGAAAAGASVDEEDEDDMLLRLAQRRAQTKKR